VYKPRRGRNNAASAGPLDWKPGRLNRTSVVCPQNFLYSRENNRAVVVAMIAVRMMQVAVDQVVDMIAMRHRFVPASRLVDMSRFMTAAVVARCALVRIFRADLKPVLVYMITMWMM
jgi:hypothetical protein